jgi:hypothetical protein
MMGKIRVFGLAEGCFELRRRGQENPLRETGSSFTQTHPDMRSRPAGANVEKAVQSFRLPSSVFLNSLFVLANGWKRPLTGDVTAAARNSKTGTAAWLDKYR